MVLAPAKAPCRMRHAGAALGGTPAAWSRLDRMDLQDIVVVGFIVLARKVESVCGVFCKCSAIYAGDAERNGTSQFFCS